jgi:hypothetical protein
VTVADRIATLIDETPPWSEVTAGDQAGLRAIEDRLRPIKEYSVEEVVEGLRRFVERRRASANGYDVPAMSKLYVLNRYLFDVPPRVPAGRPRFGGFTGVPTYAGAIDELWPWQTSANGEIRLTGAFRGFVGEAYQAVEEARAFQAEYGVRNH